MTILSAFRRRSAGAPAASPPGSSSESTSSAAPTTPSAPLDGYDRLSEREVNASLPHHSQAELAAIEDYERANKARVAVLDKLRYMRGSEPLEGYDDLSSQEVVDLLETADMATIKRIRAYERKFANRSDVISQVARVHGRIIDRDGMPKAPGVRASEAAAADRSA